MPHHVNSILRAMETHPRISSQEVLVKFLFLKGPAKCSEETGLVEMWLLARVFVRGILDATRQYINSSMPDWLDFKGHSNC